MPKFPFPIRYINAVNREFSLDEIHRLTVFNTLAGPVRGETGIPGMKLDFNAGIRLQLPAGNWRAQIADEDSDQLFFDEPAAEIILCSAEKFYIRFRVQVFLNEQLIFSHIFDPREQNVFFYLDKKLGMGDILALLPAIEAFRRQHGCTVLCAAPPAFHDLIRQAYPFQLTAAATDETYATYYMGAWRNSPFESPMDQRLIPLAATGGVMLGLHTPPPLLKLSFSTSRLIHEPYVCIARQASLPLKYWLRPQGWETIVQYLRQIGYRVLVIDRERTFTINDQVMELPDGAEDYTGNQPLLERAALLAHADFFIGLGSGLAWLAHTVNIPIILISGFSLPFTEFYTPYRIFNPLVCHGCHNDVTVPTNQCRYAGTGRIYECSRAISPKQVITAIQQVIADRQR